MEQRDPKLDACDKEIAEVLAKYGKTIRPVAFIDPEGKIAAQVVYFDVLPPEAPEAEEPKAESPLAE